MKIHYDKEVDTLYLKLSELPISESDEMGGVIVDYADNGRIVGVEILNASKRTDSPAKVEYEFS
jgi:uncharacterized protein YuzE